MTFWLNGGWREDPAAIHIDDRGLLLGDGVFETILVRNSVPAFLDRHLERLSHGLKGLALNAAPPGGLCDIIGELALRNSAQDEDAILRLTITRGPSGRGLAYPERDASRPTTLMTLTRAGPAHIKERKLTISEGARAGAGVTAQYKTLAYIENIVAHNEAVAAGADDALLLNPAGNVACAATANIFVIAPDGVVATPPVADGVLPGIVRGVLLEIADSAGIVITERSISPDDLNGGMIFLTNSLIGLAPARLGGSRDTRSSEIFKRLDACYQRALGEDLRQVGAA